MRRLLPPYSTTRPRSTFAAAALVATGRIESAYGNRTQAARALGLSLSTLRDKPKQFGLEHGDEIRMKK
jgi:DNA-binding NtrC family response regulator